MEQIHMRRLSDKIIAAHNQACDEGKMDVADMLLQALEMDVSRIGGDKKEGRESVERLEEAFNRHHEAKAKHGPG
ncbi:MAG: hypothetical protein OEY85_06205 [Rhodospirillales bacterium]|nr:hypothetical protein [Rhodospirillales bacterium]